MAGHRNLHIMARNCAGCKDFPPRHGHCAPIAVPLISPPLEARLSEEKIAVIGLGYVGLPAALSLARKYPTTGFDINEARVETLRAGRDSTGEVDDELLKGSPIKLTCNPVELAGHTVYIVAVPTPIDQSNRPDLSPLLAASRTVGKVLSRGSIVIYESTVYPGVTEEVCAPVLAEMSGLQAGVDFQVAYSPERINPGDTEHTFERIVKVVSAQSDEALDRVAALYGSVIEAGVHRAPSIKVAEAAKVIENTQRDLNIALMNELALIFDRLGIRTKDVLDAAGTKWNFLRFSPGLVGGHCIGVDPYYLTNKAEEVGYLPEVILAGRRINDGMGSYVAQKVIKMMAVSETPLRKARVGILGLTFKENVPDLRNSRVPDIVEELAEFGVSALVHDPLAVAEEAHDDYGIELAKLDDMSELDAVVLAVPHQVYLQDIDRILSLVRDGGVIIDVKSVIAPPAERDLQYWSL
jgi:UDP-N-acetyl-D-galactosamine dehydrogenase